MCSFRSLKQACSQQGSQAYDVGVTKGARSGGESDESACTEEKAKHLSQTNLNIPGIDTNAPF